MDLEVPGLGLRLGGVRFWHPMPSGSCAMPFNGSLYIEFFDTML